MFIYFYVYIKIVIFCYICVYITTIYCVIQLIDISKATPNKWLFIFHLSSYILFDLELELATRDLNTNISVSMHGPSWPD